MSQDTKEIQEAFTADQITTFKFLRPRDDSTMDYRLDIRTNNEALIKIMINNFRENLLSPDVIRITFKEWDFKEWITESRVEHRGEEFQDKEVFKVNVWESDLVNLVVEGLIYLFKHDIDPMEFFKEFGLDLSNSFIDEGHVTSLSFLVTEKIVNILVHELKTGKDCQWTLCAFDMFKDQYFEIINIEMDGIVPPWLQRMGRWDSIALVRYLRPLWLLINLKDDLITPITFQTIFNKFKFEIENLSYSDIVGILTEDFRDNKSPADDPATDTLNDFLAWLVSTGLNLNASDSDGKTVLMEVLEVATVRPLTNLVRILIINGASVLATDSNNRSPLDYALARQYKNDYIKVLMSSQTAVSRLLPSNKGSDNPETSDQYKESVRWVRNKLGDLKEIVKFVCLTLGINSQEGTPIPRVLTEYLMDDHPFPLLASAQSEFQQAFITPMFNSTTQRLINFHRRQIDAAAPVKPLPPQKRILLTTQGKPQPNSAEVKDKKENDETMRVAESASTSASGERPELYNADGTMNFRALSTLHDAAIQRQTADAARDRSRSKKSATDTRERHKY